MHYKKQKRLLSGSRFCFYRFTENTGHHEHNPLEAKRLNVHLHFPLLCKEFSEYIPTPLRACPPNRGCSRP